jgi:hypothetical protein
MNIKNPSGIDEALSDSALESVVGGKSKVLTSISHFFSEFGDTLLDNLEGAYDFFRSAGYEGEGVIRNLFDGGSGAHDLQQRDAYYNSMNLAGLNAQLDAHHNSTIEVLSGITAAGMMTIAGAATGGIISGTSESIFNSVAERFKSETTSENIVPRNEALNTLIGQLSEDSRATDTRIDGSNPDMRAVSHSANSIRMIDEVTAGRIRELMNEKQPGYGDRVFAAIDKHAESLMDRDANTGNRLVSMGKDEALQETLEDLIRDPDGSLARAMHLPPTIGEALLMIKAQTVMLFSGMRELSGEAAGDVHDGLGSELAHHGGSFAGGWINTHPAEIWDPPSEEPAYVTLDHAIQRVGGQDHMGGVNEILWNRNMTGIESETQTLAHRIAAQNNITPQEVLTAANEHANSVVDRLAGDKIAHLVRDVGHVFDEYLTEKNGHAPTQEEVRNEIKSQIEDNQYGLIRAAIEGQDHEVQMRLMNDARAFQYQFESMKAEALNRAAHDAGGSQYGRAPEQPNPLEGHDLGHMTYFGGDRLMSLEDLGNKEFRFRGYDVQKILDDPTTQHMPTAQEVPLNEIMRQYGPQLDLLRAEGVLNALNEPKLLSALQHIGENQFEAARFKIETVRTVKDSAGRTVEGPDGQPKTELVSREVTLKSPTFDQELSKLDHVQRYMAEDWADHYAQQPDTWGMVKTGAKFGAYIGAEGVLLSDLLEMTQANEGDLDPKLPGMDRHESTLAYVSANHEALIRAIETPRPGHHGEHYDINKIMIDIRKFAKSETIAQSSQTDNKANQTQLEMYNTIDLLAHGKITASDVGVPASFVDQLKKERTEALDTINLQTRVATSAAMDDYLTDHPQWAATLEEHGHGTSAEDKKINAMDRILSGDLKLHETQETASFISHVRKIRERYMSDMPETALIAGMSETNKIPIGLGLTVQRIAGMTRIDRLLRDQDEQFSHLHLSVDDEAHYYRDINTRALIRLKESGHNIPNSLKPLLEESGEHSHQRGAVTINPMAESSVLGYLASATLAGDLHKPDAAEQKAFLKDFLEIREQELTKAQPPTN